MLACHTVYELVSDSKPVDRIEIKYMSCYIWGVCTLECSKLFVGNLVCLLFRVGCDGGGVGSEENNNLYTKYRQTQNTFTAAVSIVLRWKNSFILILIIILIFINNNKYLHVHVYCVYF